MVTGVINAGINQFKVYFCIWFDFIIRVTEVLFSFWVVLRIETSEEYPFLQLYKSQDRNKQNIKKQGNKTISKDQHSVTNTKILNWLKCCSKNSKF